MCKSLICVGVIGVRAGVCVCISVEDSSEGTGVCVCQRVGSVE